MSRESRIKRIIEDHFPEWSQLELINESHQHSRGTETHYKLLLVHESFEGVSRVGRHRKVLSLFREEMDLGLHSLSLRLLTAQEYTEMTPSFKTPSCQGASVKSSQ